MTDTAAQPISSSPTPIMDKPPKPIPFAGVKRTVSQPVIASFMAGGIAGAVSRTVVSPLERLKILLQVQTTGVSEYKLGIWKALQKIWREEGMKGMMAGNGTNCIRIVPYSAVQFGSYNIYKPLVCAARAQIYGGGTLANIYRYSNQPPARTSHPAAASSAAPSPA